MNQQGIQFGNINSQKPISNTNKPSIQENHYTTTGKSSQTYSFEIPKSPNDHKSSNYVSTTKYSMFSFLPLALIRQFRRYANIYFLISAMMQCIPLISPLVPFSAILPLIIVVGLSMLRQGYEDVKRYRNDTKNNSNKCIKLDRFGNEVQIQWKDVIPSDLLKINQNDQIPADVVPLVSSASNGLIYLQTASLDGQKNLKPKNSIKQTQLIYNRDINQFLSLRTGKLSCIQPNANLYQFQGMLNFDKIQGQIQLTHKNLLPRGSILKNTQSIIAVVVYTGHSTKIMMNDTSGGVNISNIQSKLNFLILGILVFQFICCAISSILCYVQCNSHIQFISYLGQDYSCSQKAGISFGSYFILYNTFIPISLIVSLEFVKVFQGYFMEIDPQMYSYQTNKSLKANSVSINQELGQVQYIMSDKTGTLTCNKMVFKQVVIGKSMYSKAMNSRPSSFNRTSNVQLLINEQRKTRLCQPVQKNQKDEDQDFDYSYLKKTIKKYPLQEQNKTMNDIIGNQRNVIQQLMNIISTCHECIRQPKTQQYQGPSPDEVTLVQAARKAGYQYLSTQNKIITVNKFGTKDTFQLLQVFEFDSDRKRMSVVVLHNGILKLYVKGADATILPRLSKDNQPFKEYINQAATQMSQKGLRSLYYAMRILPMQLKNRIPLSSDIQTELTLLGLTGIEDKLQDFVPQTIQALRLGGIKIVLLTGDKLQTAENISKSCGLVNQTVHLKSGRYQQLKQVYSKVKKNQNLSVIADGSQMDFSQNRLLITNIILAAESTVLCRVTPGQKAQVVQMIKDTGKRTLAVGDGANDCNMIQTAHVGVGLFGKQGTRAAQVANFSIGQFCLLWKLLLYHGRLNYIRISQMILYFFYKNMVFTMPQFIFSFFSMGSGQSVYLSWAITCYNMIFTLLPVLIVAVFENDIYIQAGKDRLIQVSKKTVDDQAHEKLYQYYPKLYYVGRCNTIFTIKSFVSWFALGALQGTLCILINIFTLTNRQQTNGIESHPMSFHFLQISLCTCIVIVVNIKLALNVQRWNCLLAIGFILTIIAYALYIILANFAKLSPTRFYHGQLLSTINFYLTQFLSICGMLSIDMLLFSVSSTKSTLQNYIKYQTIKGKVIRQKDLQNLRNTYDKKQQPKSLQQIERQISKSNKSRSVSEATQQQRNSLDDQLLNQTERDSQNSKL